MNIDRAESFPLRRREVAARLLQDRGELLVVSALDAPSWDVAAAGDSPLTFPLWGAMGGAVSMGLGLALARPERRVLVGTGDGEMLMGLGSLATVGLKQPVNLAIVVLDNERYGETGIQATHTAGPGDLAALAVGAGFPVAGGIYDDAQLSDALLRIRAEPGPVFFDIKVRAEELPLVMPPKAGAELKDRFRRALLGPEG